MKCPNCGAESVPGASFCQECGTSLPKTKNCIKCGKEIPVDVKFCPECGTNQEQKSEEELNSGLRMGDKNVIAGDVTSTVNNNQQIHHDETYSTVINNTTNNTTNTTNNTTNTTNINIKDDTKEACTCALCGKHTLIVNGYTCPNCGSFVCENDFNKDFKVCKKCSGEHVSSNGRISSFKVFKAKYTEIEASKSDSKLNAVTSMMQVEPYVGKLCALIENFEIPESADEIIKFLSFAKIKMGGQYSVMNLTTNPMGLQAISNAFSSKIKEIQLAVQTMEMTPAQMREIRKVSKGYNRKGKGMVIFGYICSAIVVILSIIVLVYMR